MILTAGEPGIAPHRASCLTSLRAHEFVALHALRGAVAGDRHSAVAKADATAKGTKGKTPLPR